MKSRSPQVRAARAFANERRAIRAYHAGRLPLRDVIELGTLAERWRPKWWRDPPYRPRMDYFCFPKGAKFTPYRAGDPIPF